MRKTMITAILLSAALSISAFASPTIVNAAEPSTAPGTVSVQPLWVTLQTISSNMSYSGGKVNWNATLSGNSSTASISATFYLEKYNGNGSYWTVGTWSKSASGSYLTHSGSLTTASGATYRLTVAATVTATNGTSESVSSSLIKTF